MSCENDYIIENLEKIKVQYIFFKNTLKEKDQMIEELKKCNKNLRTKLNQLQTELLKSPKRRQNSNSISFDGSPLLERSNIFGNGKVLADQSTDDLNIALNSENQFNDSSISPKQLQSPLRAKIKQEPRLHLSPRNHNVMRTPITPPPTILPTNLPKFNKSLSMRNNSFNNENKKPSGDWRSKNRRSSIQKNDTSIGRSNWNMSFLQPVKRNLSLKTDPNRFKQNRLGFEVKKDDSMILGSGDETFCEDMVEVTPKQEFRGNKSTIRSLITRKLNDNCHDDKEDFFNLSTAKNSPTYPKLEINKQTNKDTHNYSPDKTTMDSSSLFILSPEKDVICIDEDYTNLNIESGDLLSDMMDHNESGQFLHHMRKLENDRIKQLHKKFEQPVETVTSAAPTTMPTVNSESEEEFNHQPIKIKEEKSPTTLQPKITPPKLFKAKEKKFDVACDDCQNYIKFFGDRKTDEEIEMRIRNCTRHKKDVYINPTPDGYWDPFIASMAADDPRNITLIDDRFVKDKK